MIEKDRHLLNLTNENNFLTEKYEGILRNLKNEYETEFENMAICKKNDIAVFLKPEYTTIRILGSGKIL